MYRVIYDGPTDKLRGVVLSLDFDNGWQYLFKDEGLDDYNNPKDIVCEYLHVDFYMNADKEIDKSSKPDIKSGAHIILNGPAEASIDAAGGFCLRFYLCGAFHGSINVESDVESEMPPLPQKAVFLSDDGKRFFKIYYAIFHNAVEANVKVKLTHAKSECDLYGAISARTSAISHPAYSTIIFFKEEHGEKMKLKSGKETSLSLSRSFVAVPLGFQLILEFGLIIDNKRLQDKLFIDVKTDAERSNTFYEIPCSHCKIQVEIDWRSKRNPRELERLDLSSDEEDEEDA